MKNTRDIIDDRASQLMSTDKNVIPVTYLCWGCGGSVTKYEPTDLPIPAREVWNICPACRNLTDPGKAPKGV